MHEFVVGDLDQPRRLRVEAAARPALGRRGAGHRGAGHPLLVDRRDACEQFGVQVNGVVVGGELRSEGRLRLLQRGIGVRARDAVERLEGAVEQAAAPLQRHESIRKRRRLPIVRDGLDLGELLRHPGLDRRPVVLILDLVERRRLKRQCARRIEGIRRPELHLRLIRPRRSGAQRGTRRQRNEQLASHLSCPRRLRSDCMEAPARSTRVCRPFLLSSRTRHARARGCRRADRP